MCYHTYKRCSTVQNKNPTTTLNNIYLRRNEHKQYQYFIFYNYYIYEYLTSTNTFIDSRIGTVCLVVKATYVIVYQKSHSTADTVLCS